MFQFIESFETNLIKNKTKNLGVIYRNYSSKLNESNLIKFKKFCQKNSIKLYLANNINLAVKLMLSGVYIPAFNKKKILKKFKLRKNFEVLGSAHNIIEINRKIEQGCELIFLAPLFKTKKSKKYLNIIKFNILTLNKKVKFVALGGINNNNISKTKMLNICGISAISMFQKKTGL